MHCIVCQKPLRKDNTIGTCRKHRGRSPSRKSYEDKWKLDNKERYNKAKNKWTRENPGYYKEWRKNINNKLAHILRARIRRAIKTGSAVQNLGCTVQEFKAHLESLFTPGMTWENYGHWQIDHILPLSKFDLTDPEKLAKACHFTNMQPLWKADNIRKSNKVE